MIEHPIITIMAFLLLSYGLFSKSASKTIITAPLFFVIVGIAISFLPIEVLKGGARTPLVKILAELTLILVLFVDASTLDLQKLRRERALPMRLLGIGLPITMIVGALVAIVLFPGEPYWNLLLMALILSPTDAALGQAVVSSNLVPQKIRQTINVESGLNDGIALPPILICFAIISGQATGESGTVAYWLLFVLKQFVFGPALGGLVGWLGGLLVDRASKRGWMNHTYQQLASVSLAILAFSLAESVHGNGFIAAYCAGMMLGTQTPEIRDRIREFGEAESHAMVLFIFLLFGIILVPISSPLWDWQSVVYALLSLTFIRMAPVALSLIGSGLSRRSIWFIGWFGPRGIASVLYLLMLILQLGNEGYEKIISVITLTILFSILLHGITAVPFSKLFGNESSG